MFNIFSIVQHTDVFINNLKTKKTPQIISLYDKIRIRENPYSGSVLHLFCTVLGGFNVKILNLKIDLSHKENTQFIYDYHSETVTA